MKFRYSVTFESNINPPQTYKGEVIASTFRACVGRAFQEAYSNKHNKDRWSSLVIVLDKHGTGSEENNDYQLEDNSEDA